MIPTPEVRKVAPVCRVCGRTSSRDNRLIERDGPPVCRICIIEAGTLGRATVSRSDTPRRKPR
jgi:thymidine kinase